MNLEDLEHSLTWYDQNKHTPLHESGFQVHQN